MSTCVPVRTRIKQFERRRASISAQQKRKLFIGFHPSLQEDAELVSHFLQLNGFTTVLGDDNPMYRSIRSFKNAEFFSFIALVNESWGTSIGCQFDWALAHECSASDGIPHLYQLVYTQEYSHVESERSIMLDGSDPLISSLLDAVERLLSRLNAHLQLPPVDATDFLSPRRLEQKTQLKWRNQETQTDVVVKATISSQVDLCECFCIMNPIRTPATYCMPEPRLESPESLTWHEVAVNADNGVVSGLLLQLHDYMFREEEEDENDRSAFRRDCLQDAVSSSSDSGDECEVDATSCTEKHATTLKSPLHFRVSRGFKRAKRLLRAVRDPDTLLLEAASVALPLAWNLIQRMSELTTEATTCAVEIIVEAVARNASAVGNDDDDVEEGVEGASSTEERVGAACESLVAMGFAKVLSESVLHHARCLQPYRFTSLKTGPSSTKHSSALGGYGEKGPSSLSETGGGVSCERVSCEIGVDAHGEEGEYPPSPAVQNKMTIIAGDTLRWLCRSGSVAARAQVVRQLDSSEVFDSILVVLGGAHSEEVSASLVGLCVDLVWYLDIDGANSFNQNSSAPESQKLLSASSVTSGGFPGTLVPREFAQELVGVVGRHPSARYFGESLIQLLNRADRGQSFSWACLVMLSKFFIDTEARDLFFPADLKIVLEVLVREICNVDDDDECLPFYLSTVFWWFRYGCAALSSASAMPTRTVTVLFEFLGVLLENEETLPGSKAVAEEILREFGPEYGFSKYAEST